MTQFLLLIFTAASAHVLTPSYKEGKELAGTGKEQIKEEMTSPAVQAFGKEAQGKGQIPTTSDLGRLTDSPINFPWVGYKPSPLGGIA